MQVTFNSIKEKHDKFIAGNFGHNQHLIIAGNFGQYQSFFSNNHYFFYPVGSCGYFLGRH